MIYRARTENTEMFIAMYETEKPELIKGGLLTGDALNTYYAAQLQQWQSSKREYKVRDIDQSALRVILEKEVQRLNPSVNSYNGELSEALQKGIDCTFLKNRLKLEYGCVECEGVDSCKNGCEGTYSVGYWTLLPLEDKKENERNMWLELEQIFYNRADWMEQAQKQFTIIRKQNK